MESSSKAEAAEMKGERNVCDTHTDTGILTVAIASSMPGLEIWDKIRKEFVKIEEEVQPQDLVIFPGEKLTLFSCEIPACPHRVASVQCCHN
jgi:isopenicillin N synthase-like dioxygenase